MTVLLKELIYLHDKGICAEISTSGIFQLITSHHIFAKKLGSTTLGTNLGFFSEYPIASYIVLYKSHKLDRKKTVHTQVRYPEWSDMNNLLLL